MLSASQMALEQNRHQHEPGPMGRRHDERPTCEIPRAHAHPHPAWVAHPQEAKDAKPEDGRGSDNAHNGLGQDGLGYCREGDNPADRRGVPQCDGRQRRQDRSAALLLQAQCHGKQPSHRGVDPMIRAEGSKHEPGPWPRHGKQNESDELSPPCRRT
jgi:hypothetical protein